MSDWRMNPMHFTPTTTVQHHAKPLPILTARQWHTHLFLEPDIPHWEPGYAGNQKVHNRKEPQYGAHQNLRRQQLVRH